MVTDKRSELDAILYNYRKGTETVDKSIDSILALFSPDEECTTFYAHVICYPNEPALLGYPTTDENAAKTSAVCEFCNGHVVAIHIPNRLLQPRAATVTECKAEEAK